ncbi:CAP domain-containing protein [Solibacillus daqui]|uniref:CAP domain-containing protein n=1 Tax=Solibacillus daqui TaxID=2912187 RepID=UPI00236519DB|nr:CAP-associated domain-containing protein [Solibacillus daqui]
MKALFQILIVATCICIVVYYTNVEPSKTEVLEGPTTITKPVIDLESTQQSINELPRPTTGISIYIGKSANGILDNYGKPVRVDPTEFGYEWWVYENKAGLFMVGVMNNIVTQIYTNDMNFNTTPYTINESIDDIYRMTIFEQEVTFESDDNVYLFAMNEEDMKNRILVKYDDVYIQLYIDNETNTLYGVRFIDGATLVLHKSYEMQFFGKLVEANTPSSFAQIEINLANGRILTALTNAFREKFELPKLAYSNVLTSLASDNSEQMFLTLMETQTTESEKFDVGGELVALEFSYEQLGENVAANYKDPIEVLHGWINSKEHRALVLNEEYTHIGSGAYVNNFTQLYMK